MSTAPALASLARSREVTISATPPSLIRQQSSRCSGSTIQRELWWSAMVIGSRITAFGLSEALRRPFTATQPSCSLVVPYSAMCLLAPSALLAALPYMPQLLDETAAPLGAENREPPVRAASPKTTATTSAIPALTASAACCTSMPAVAPPALSDPAIFGLMPRCSPRRR